MDAANGSGTQQQGNSNRKTASRPRNERHLSADLWKVTLGRMRESPRMGMVVLRRYSVHEDGKDTLCQSTLLALLRLDHQEGLKIPAKVLSARSC